MVHNPNSDFNGDGRSDILWRHVNGEIYTWITNATGGFADYYVPSHVTVPLNWHVAGIGDFNGDNKDDILWRENNGQLSISLAQANGSFSSIDANPAVGVSINWHIQGIGDFDGDGKDDVLWRDDNGLLVTWLGQANGSLSDNYLNSVVAVPTNWHVQGIGDFNGDGKDDILWREDNGLVTDWLGQAGGGFAQNYLNSAADVPLEWQVDAIGDFNGDGKDDILWRHDSGVIEDWLAKADGGFIDNYANSVVWPASDWDVAEVADFNGDGRDDILWRDNIGDVIDWAGQANGGFAYNPSYSLFGGQSLEWHVQGESLF